MSPPSGVLLHSYGEGINSGSWPAAEVRLCVLV